MLFNIFDLLDGWNLFLTTSSLHKLILKKNILNALPFLVISFVHYWFFSLLFAQIKSRDASEIMMDTILDVTEKGMKVKTNALKFF